MRILICDNETLFLFVRLIRCKMSQFSVRCYLLFHLIPHLMHCRYCILNPNAVHQHQLACYDPVYQYSSLAKTLLPLVLIG